jgi:hypothetical protein
MLKSKKEIENWLKEMAIESFHINEDLTVDVEKRVLLNGKNLTHLPIQFNEVKGSFYISSNQLSTLKGVPNKVEGIFNCSKNNLTNLTHSPQIIKDSFICSENKLTSLLGAPLEVGGNFFCDNNLLSSLEYVPLKIKGNLLFNYNPIQTLKFFPQIAGNKMFRLEGLHLSKITVKELVKLGMTADFLHVISNFNEAISELKYHYKSFENVTSALHIKKEEFHIFLEKFLFEDSLNQDSSNAKKIKI